MRIGDIELPDSEVEKLSRKRRQLFDLMVGAYPGGVTGWSMTLAAGTGRASRMDELNKGILDKYNLIIRGQQIGSNREGSNLF